MKRKKRTPFARIDENSPMKKRRTNVANCPERPVADSKEISESDDPVDVKVGSRVSIHWDLDDEWYSGTAHEKLDAIHSYTIHYDDGDVEDLDMSKDRFILAEEEAKDDEEFEFKADREFNGKTHFLANHLQHHSLTHVFHHI